MYRHTHGIVYSLRTLILPSCVTPILDLLNVFKNKRKVTISYEHENSSLKLS